MIVRETTYPVALPHDGGSATRADRWVVRRYHRAVRHDGVLCYRYLSRINGDVETEVRAAYVWKWHEIGRWAVTSWKAGDRHTYHTSFKTFGEAADHARQRVGLPLPVREDRHVA